MIEVGMPSFRPYKKGMRGREEKKGKGKVFNNALLCLENLPQDLKREGKKRRERGRKKRERGRKKRRGGGKRVRWEEKRCAKGREENISKGPVEGFQQCHVMS